MQNFYNTLTHYTARAYREDLKDFGKWFGETNGQSMAAELVTGVDLREYQAYMTTVRGLKPATVNRRLVDIVTVSVLMGHSRIDTTARYTLPGWADLESAIERWR